MFSNTCIVCNVSISVSGVKNGAMHALIRIISLISIASGQTTFKVFNNTLDPSVFGQNGGATLNAKGGDGFVDAVTICLRFQVGGLEQQK